MRPTFCLDLSDSGRDEKLGRKWGERYFWHIILRQCFRTDTCKCVYVCVSLWKREGRGGEEKEKDEEEEEVDEQGRGGGSWSGGVEVGVGRTRHVDTTLEADVHEK